MPECNRVPYIAGMQESCRNAIECRMLPEYRQATVLWEGGSCDYILKVWNCGRKSRESLRVLRCCQEGIWSYISRHWRSFHRAAGRVVDRNLSTFWDRKWTCRLLGLLRSSDIEIYAQINVVSFSFCLLRIAAATTKQPKRNRFLFPV